ncbi:MAG: YbaK/EbsC family protein [Candidatus Rokubacteria bacterium]|nr:YbaK/EbsC family protein [Candidatus Rokubacteria bacterium]
MTTARSAPLSPSAQKVQDTLAARGFAYQVTESAQPTGTSAEAARLVGCEVGQIAKSLVFRTVTTWRPVLVIASGANRVSEPRVGAIVGEAIGKADADFVRAATGFAIGGIPPLGHARAMEVLVDEDLLRHDAVWAAAGTPHSLFRLAPCDLVRMSGGRVARIT